MDHPCSPRAYAIAELFPQKAEAKTALLIFSNTSKGVPFTPTLNGQTAALASMPLTRCACQGTKCQPWYVIEGSRLQGNNSANLELSGAGLFTRLASKNYIPSAF